MIRWLHTVHERPIAGLMICLGPMLLGIVAAVRLPVGLLPEWNYPALSVEVDYNGVGPEKMEEQITGPLEEVISTVGGIEQLFSISEEGRTRIHIEFSAGSDLERKSLEIRERIEPVALTFPRETQKPVLHDYDPSRQPLMVIILESTRLDLTELRGLAESEIQRDLESIEGISELIVAGGRVREIIVAGDRDRLVGHGLTPNHVLAAIGDANKDASAGRVTTRGGELPLYVRGAFSDLEDIRRVPLKTADGVSVRVNDVARVSYGLRDQESASRVNGRDRVGIYIYKTGDANVLDVSTAVRAQMRQFRRDDYQWRITYDQAELIAGAFRNSLLAATVGMLLVIAGLLLLRWDYRSAMSAVVPLPAGFLICSLVLFMQGLRYDLITLTGMLLSAGLSLPVGIIVMEGVRRNENSRDTIARAGLVGLLFSIITFVPVLALSGAVRPVYKSMAMSVLGMYAAAFLIALVLLPILWRYIRPGDVSREERRFDKPATSIKDGGRVYTYMQRIRTGLGLIRNDGSPRKERLIRIWLLRRPLRFLLVYSLILILGATVYALSRKSFVQTLTAERLNAVVEMPSGTSFAATDQAVRDVEAKLQEAEGIEEMVARIEPAHADIQITLKEGTRADADYIDYLKETVGAAEPAFVYFTREEAQGGFDSVTVNVMGEDFTVLDELAQKLAGKMSEQEGISDAVLRYKQPRPERKLVVARDKAEGAGLSPGSVGENLRLAIQGGVATKFLENNREVDVRVRYNERFRADLDSLEHYMLQGSHGYVPLFAVAGLEEGTIPVKIYRRDKKRMLSFSVRPGDIDLDEAIEKIEALRAEPLPEDYRIEYGHEFRRLIESRRRTYGMLLAVLLLAYMFLATWTESLTQPLRMLLILPPPLSAALLALYIFDVDMSVQMIVGLLLLCGLLFVQLSYARLTDGRAPYWRSAVVAMALFYLPFGLVSGEGAEMTRGIAIVLSVGALTGVITTPMVERVTRSRRMRIALKRMGVQISDRLRRVGERLWPSDTLRK